MEETIIVYHNPRCSKSRMALTYLEEQGVAFNVVEYLKESISKKQLKEVLSYLEMSAFDLVRKNEIEYKENYKGKELSENEWVEILISHPKLIERPIVIKSKRAVIARPTEKIDELIK